MAKTVNGAFSTFNKEYVNLDSERTKIARSSRDWLYTQLNGFPDKHSSFPFNYTERHVKFGSFARNTKIRELDDIDLIYCFTADNAYYLLSNGVYYIKTDNSGKRLKDLSNEQNQLSSIKVVNKLVSCLADISNYKSAEIHRRQEAATLNLVSYEWNFDIVPAFYTDTGFYLIPDGNGNWKATNPPLDQEYVSRINGTHDHSVHQLIRTLKYWNRRAKMPSMSSYLFENFALNFCESKSELNQFIDINMIHFWDYLTGKVHSAVSDPKGIQSDLNTLSYDERDRISEKAKATYQIAIEANRLETNESDHNKAINKWKEIFGPDFPSYT